MDHDNSHIESGIRSCDRELCKKEWNRWSQKTESEEDLDYKNGNYGLTHCQRSGCHEIYFRGKNGWDCHTCGVHYCENCSSEYMVEVVCNTCHEPSPLNHQMNN